MLATCLTDLSFVNYGFVAVSPCSLLGRYNVSEERIAFILRVDV
jgi:hypothetical protein